MPSRQPSDAPGAALKGGCVPLLVCARVALGKGESDVPPSQLDGPARVWEAVGQDVRLSDGSRSLGGAKRPSRAGLGVGVLAAH